MASLFNFFLLLLLNFISFASLQYSDDSDYDDFDLYDLPTSNNRKNKNKNQPPRSDDFYIIPEDSEGQEKSLDPVKMAHENMYKLPESIKVYHYTKHRIPGYDYDEFDLTNNKNKNSNTCDDKSIWSHCLCQFTCNEMNSVDCFTPCESGCQCREDYVYDEENSICIKPEYCEKIII